MSNPRVNTISLGKTEFTEAAGVKLRYGDERVTIHQLKQIDQRATLAIQLAERWGMVAAENDGEDSAGRAKLRLMSPGEIADRACAAAQAIFDQFEARGWLIEMPPMEKIIADLAAKEEPPASQEQKQS